MFTLHAAIRQDRHHKRSEIAANHVAEPRFLVDLVHHNAAIVHAIALDGILFCEECIEQCLSGLDL